jgi:hypothetical protein
MIDYQQLSGIEIVLESDELLRKKWRGLPAAQEAFRREAVTQMQTLDRRPFHADVQVAVQLDLHHPHADNQPHIPGVVKAYLDALEGVAYTDDRQVSSLTVHRRGADHPMMSGARRDHGRASIFASVLPVERYTELYDRAVRTMFSDRARSPWWPQWSIRDEVELVELRRQAKTARGGPDLGLTRHLRLLEETRLRAGVLADIDRPGPPPKVVSAIHRVLPLPKFHWAMRRRHPATLLLGLRGSGPGTSHLWNDEVRGKLEDFRATRAGWPFGGFVALDVAVRGRSTDGKDLDNLVHGFLIPFEELLCAARGTVASYRAYEAVGEPEGVQVRVLDDLRLLELEMRMAEARSPTRAERLLERAEAVQEQLRDRQEQLRDRRLR